MKRNISIQLKAALLVIVFSLNTVISFACSVGIDMEFNTTHHHDEENKTITRNISHHHDKSHHHGETDNDQHKSGNGKGNCCNDEVIKFAQVDKSVSQPLSLGINPIFLTSFISSFYNIDVLFASQATPNIKYFVRSYHPPIPDIRIAIQSFQI